MISQHSFAARLPRTRTTCWLLRVAAAVLLAATPGLLHAQGQPLQLHEGFEQTAVGKRPASLRVFDGKLPESVRVVEDGAKAGRRCLRFNDGPEATPPWDPHVYLVPNHRRGTSKFAFDIKLDQAASVAMEIRDGEQPGYHSGIILQFKHGELFIHNDWKQCDYPLDTWVHVEITAKVGDDADGTYRLFVSANGKSAHFDQLPMASKEMKEIQWFGFLSPGQDVSTWSLDELEIKNEP